MAAVWKGVISFGLVSIPVELHTAVRDHRPRFRLLHAKDKSPVRYERVCQREGKAVPWRDLVKGYEYEKGKFVVLTKDDFKTAALEKSKTLDVLDFVGADEIDVRYFETPYYVTPGQGGTRGYAVLRAAISQSNSLGIGKIMLHEEQHLAALGVVDDSLILTMLRFADELVDASRFRLPSQREVRPKELELAMLLIDKLTNKWDPEKYADESHTTLMRVIKAKLKGKKPEAVAVAEPKATPVVDLMERLQRSLGQDAAARRRPARRTKPRRKAAA